jgi:hypothetical protein
MFRMHKSKPPLLGQAKMDVGIFVSAYPRYYSGLQWERWKRWKRWE